MKSKPGLGWPAFALLLVLLAGSVVIPGKLGALAYLAAIFGLVGFVVLDLVTWSEERLQEKR